MIHFLDLLGDAATRNASTRTRAGNFTRLIAGAWLEGRTGRGLWVACCVSRAISITTQKAHSRGLNRNLGPWFLLLLSSLWFLLLLSSLWFLLLLSSLWFLRLLSSLWFLRLLSSLWFLRLLSSLWFRRLLSSLWFRRLRKAGRDPRPTLTPATMTTRSSWAITLRLKAL
jgi:hypothetical protein